MFLIPHHCIFCEAGSRKAIQKYVFLTARLKMKVGLIKDCWNIKNEDCIQWSASLIQMSIMGTFIFSNKFMGTNIQVILNIFTSAIYLSSSFLCADNLVRNENVWVNKAPSYASTFQSWFELIKIFTVNLYPDSVAYNHGPFKTSKL